MAELPKAYSPKEAEERWYPFWERCGFFHASASRENTPYTVVIPPPNITGVLHMGHVLNISIQDAFVRWKRMQGFETLWMPGTDHAGIATQHVVERSLLKEGKSRHEIGREEFIRLVWKWKEQYGGTITRQLRMLGASLDWQRERFTMDDGLSAAVREMFVRWHEQGLIYRGKYIVNWCPLDHTALSDDEVIYSEQNTHLWYIRYPIKDSEEFAVIATTRPETLLGDTAVAINPADKRYKHLLDRKILLPLAGREIPIIEDESVDPKFGTGMVKVTPAHDPNDYWVAQRYNAGKSDKMPFINILDDSARLNSEVPEKYRGMDHREARKAIASDLSDLGLLLKTEAYVNNVGHCYRCDTIIQPYLSDQWFVRMQPLKGPALKAVLQGTIRFYPERWVKTYTHWMENIRDWCISRQLWWGHRIPVWYCSEGGEACADPIVARDAPEKCPRCGSKKLKQDEDVLDTWFSSMLWPFSTLGWPADNPELRYFYPTHTLVTAPDIIFFWVARMIMAGLDVMDTIPLPDGSPRESEQALVPFQHVYFTSIIRDGLGRKMSKSLGNSPDPVDVIREYGADALRFTILYLAPLGQDVLYSNEKCELGRNFANKIWNAGRFLLMNKEQSAKYPSASGLEDHLDLADRWVLSRLHSALADLTSALERFEINQATKILYEFVWHDFCDWYVEMIKGRLYGDESEEIKATVLARAMNVFDNALKMLHPVMPFVTEELWQHLGARGPNESIMITPFPRSEARWIDTDAESEMNFVQDAISGIRNIRGELSVPPSKDIGIIVDFPEASKEELFEKYQGYFLRLARVTRIERLKNGNKPKQAASAVVNGGEVFVPLEGLIDLGAERARIEKELRRVQGMVDGIERKLANESFVNRAPQDVVRKEREKLDQFRENVTKLQKNLERL